MHFIECSILFIADLGKILDVVMYIYIYTLWLFNIAMENHNF